MKPKIYSYVAMSLDTGKKYNFMASNKYYNEEDIVYLDDQNCLAKIVSKNFGGC